MIIFDKPFLDYNAQLPLREILSYRPDVNFIRNSNIPFKSLLDNPYLLKSCIFVEFYLKSLGEIPPWKIEGLSKMKELLDGKKITTKRLYLFDDNLNPNMEEIDSMLSMACLEIMDVEYLLINAFPKKLLDFYSMKLPKWSERMAFLEGMIR